jgi:hypothetical protein
MKISPSSSLDADRWFLGHGLPAVLRRGALLRRTWIRSAPALAGYAVVATTSTLIVLVSGEHTVDIEGHITRTKGFVLAMVVLVLPAAVVLGWLVSRIQRVPSRVLAASLSAAVIIIIIAAVLGGPSPRVYVNMAVSAHGCCRHPGNHRHRRWIYPRVGGQDNASADLKLVFGMFFRALPVMLLTVLVFFNTYVWLMAAIITRARLWLEG